MPVAARTKPPVLEAPSSEEFEVPKEASKALDRAEKILRECEAARKAIAWPSPPHNS